MAVRMSRAAVFLLLCVRAEFASAGSLNAPRDGQLLPADGTSSGTGTGTGTGAWPGKTTNRIPTNVSSSPEIKKHREGSKSETKGTETPTGEDGRWRNHGNE